MCQVRFVIDNDSKFVLELGFRLLSNVGTQLSNMLRRLDEFCDLVCNYRILRLRRSFKAWN
jgi:hypothetical protein